MPYIVTGCHPHVDLCVLIKQIKMWMQDIMKKINTSRVSSSVLSTFLDHSTERGKRKNGDSVTGWKFRWELQTQVMMEHEAEFGNDTVEDIIIRLARIMRWPSHKCTQRHALWSWRGCAGALTRYEWRPSVWWRWRLEEVQGTWRKLGGWASISRSESRRGDGVLAEPRCLLCRWRSWLHRTSR